MKVKLTGVIAELIGSREMDSSPVKNVAEVKQQLLLKAPELNRYKIKLAVNSMLTGERDELHPEDEVFVFGAYAGG